jgi:hypothetical protein
MALRLDGSCAHRSLLKRLRAGVSVLLDQRGSLSLQALSSRKVPPSPTQLHTRVRRDLLHTTDRRQRPTQPSAGAPSTQAASCAATRTTQIDFVVDPAVACTHLRTALPRAMLSRTLPTSRPALTNAYSGFFSIMSEGKSVASVRVALGSAEVRATTAAASSSSGSTRRTRISMVSCVARRRTQDSPEEVEAGWVHRTGAERSSECAASRC